MTKEIRQETKSKSQKSKSQKSTDITNQEFKPKNKMAQRRDGIARELSRNTKIPGSEMKQNLDKKEKRMERDNNLKV